MQREIELKSPQIAGEDEDIWRRFIIRDIPTGDKWLNERDKRIAAEDAEDYAEGKEIEQRKTDWWKIYQVRALLFQRSVMSSLTTYRN